MGKLVCFCYYSLLQSTSEAVVVLLTLTTVRWLNHNDISKPSVLKDTLTAALCSPTSSLSEDLRLSKDDIDGIIAATSSPELKKGLTQLTDEAVKLGAFGAPFFRVTADRGVSWRDGNYGNKVTEVEPFFGSDRYVVLPTLSLDLVEGRDGTERLTRRI